MFYLVKRYYYLLLFVLLKSSSDQKFSFYIGFPEVSIVLLDKEKHSDFKGLFCFWVHSGGQNQQYLRVLVSW